MGLRPTTWAVNSTIAGLASAAKAMLNRDCPRSEVRVWVREGKVRIEEEPFLAGARESMSLVAAGNMANTQEGSILVQRESLAEVEESLSWRNGYLMFREDTLRDAA